MTFEDWMKRLGCDVQRSSRARAEPAWSIQPPTFRWDLNADVDLVEEYARLNGYDKIPETAPPLISSLGSWPAEHDAGFSLEARARSSFVSDGYLQAVNCAFLSAEFQSKILGDVGRWENAGLATAPEPIRLVNPLNKELGAMRGSGPRTLEKHRAQFPVWKCLRPAF